MEFKYNEFEFLEVLTNLFQKMFHLGKKLCFYQNVECLWPCCWQGDVFVLSGKVMSLCQVAMWCLCVERLTLKRWTLEKFVQRSNEDS